jgi:hypothetical protein
MNYGLHKAQYLCIVQCHEFIHAFICITYKWWYHHHPIPTHVICQSATITTRQPFEELINKNDNFQGTNVISIDLISLDIRWCCECKLKKNEILRPLSHQVAPWPNGYGVGLRIRRLWVRVPSESISFCSRMLCI